MYRIYIVEDDPTISSLAAQGIAGWGYDVMEARDFGHILEEFQALQPDLVLLDIGLPFYNGYHWCMEIRKISRVPVVFLSSASDNMNIVMAMNLGADDFIPKPFDLNVLAAKLSAILRRAYAYGEPPPTLRFRDAELDVGAAALRRPGGSLPLTRNEVRILEALLQAKDQVVSRDRLMERLWETDNFVDENTLTVNVTRLRKKLDAFGLENVITTKKGMGYLIAKDDT